VLLLNNLSTVVSHLEEKRMTNSASIRLLIVDDDEILRECMKEYFTQKGYVVTEANDGMAGYDKYQTEEFQIVITDVKMPNMDGISLAKKMLERPSPPPIIVVSTCSTENEMIAKKLGLSFVSKPFDIKVLGKLVKQRLCAPPRNSRES
jgi:two-component system, OmpR family, response regulator